LAEKANRGTPPQGSTGTPARTKAVVVAPIVSARGGTSSEDRAQRPHVPLSPQAKLEEAVGLAEAIDLDIIHSEFFTVAQPRPATLLGAGKVEQLAGIVAEEGAELVIVDHQLTPVQQRNLERELKAKVLDRTGLILEIFGRRARTKEGRLQVDLAHLEYQRGRLVRSWTHLERQRGGGGFMGGPGETQIEADRRLLQDRITRIKRELEVVRRTRDLHRSKRRKVPFPVVAIVGYTNAGKSTLFNRLTGASVLAEDMLFATLDPTLRRVRFPHGTIVILSDTVGFISDLPPHLVAAFRATLEEVVEANLVIHLRDISDPDTTAHATDVEQVLASLGINASDASRVVEVWNKIDRLSEDDRKRLSRDDGKKTTAPVAISAITGEGLDELMALIEQRLSGQVKEISIKLSPGQLGDMDWIYRHGEVTGRKDHKDGSVTLKIRATHVAREEIKKRLYNNNKG